MRRSHKTTQFWWEPFVQALYVLFPIGLVVTGLAILFEALLGDEFGLYEGGGKWDWTFVLAAIYLGVLGGYWLGAMNGWESGERHGREQEREEASERQRQSSEMNYDE